MLVLEVPKRTVAQKIIAYLDRAEAKREAHAKKEAEEQEIADAIEAARIQEDARIAAENANRIAAQRRIEAAKQNDLTKQRVKKVAVPSVSATLNGIIARIPSSSSRVG